MKFCRSSPFRSGSSSFSIIQISLLFMRVSQIQLPLIYPQGTLHSLIHPRLLPKRRVSRCLLELIVHHLQMERLLANHIVNVIDWINAKLVHEVSSLLVMVDHFV
mmetsp:Transcript_9130/g.33689  ORF Transcript_9130/g.33689 Transcript_9130/m.33689 type:complete len:105 (+) Transcript_9130:766-1080(+)